MSWKPTENLAGFNENFIIEVTIAKLLDYRDSMYHLLSDKLEPMEI